MDGRLISIILKHYQFLIFFLDLFNNNFFFFLNNLYSAVTLLLGRPLEVWDSSSLPIVDNADGHIVCISLVTLFQFSRVLGNLFHKVIDVLPLCDTEVVDKLFVLDFVDNGLDVVFGVGDALSPDNTLENLIGLSLVNIVHNSRAINQVDSLSHLDVLPDLSLTGNGGHLATCLLHQRVDN